MLIANQQPHPYRNDEGFSFKNSTCDDPANGDRHEFPILKKGVYDGGAPGDEKQWRAVYLHNVNWPRTYEGNAVAYYCGTLYHPKGSNGFLGCDV